MVAPHKKPGSPNLLVAVAVGAGAFILLQMIAYGVQTRQDQPGAIANSLASTSGRQMSASRAVGDPVDDEFFHSPFLADRALLDLKKEMDREREDFLRGFSALRSDKSMRALTPAFKFDEDEKGVTVSVNVPDVPLKDISIEVIDGTVLHVSGGKKTEKDGVTSEIRFDRKFALGRGIDQENISAKLKDGTLTITTPKAVKGKEKKVRKIAIEEF